MFDNVRIRVFHKSLLLLVSVAHLHPVNFAFLCVPRILYLMYSSTLIRHNVEILVCANRWSANHMAAAFGHMEELEFMLQFKVRVEMILKPVESG